MRRHVIELKHPHHIVSASRGADVIDMAKILKFDFTILDRPDVPFARSLPGTTCWLKAARRARCSLLRKGRVQVHRNGKAFEEIDAGGIFGEMALIDQAPRDATVTAIEDSEVTPIDERLFVVLVQNAAYFGLEVMRGLVTRVRATNLRV